MRSHFGTLIAACAVLALAGSAAALTGAARASFDVDELETSRLGAYVSLSIEGCRSMADVGEPELPVRILRFVIPADARVEDLVVEYDEVQLPGTHRVMPAQREVPIGETAEWVDPKASVYGSDAPYPAKRVEYLGDGFLGGYRIASVAVYPLQYAPASGRLTMATDISVELVLGNGADRSLPRHRVTAESERLYGRLVAGMVENPLDVRGMRGSDVTVVEDAGPEGFLPRYTPSLDGSPVEYVIITNDVLAPYFQELADWKTTKGIPAVVRTVAWINSNYPGGCDTQERIRMFIQDAYSSWGTTYVLLGGDTDIVPVRKAYTTYYGGESIPCDLYYSDLDGNWNADGDNRFGEGYRGVSSPGDSVDLYSDVFVGRAPVRNVVHIETFLDKTEAYEKTPVPHFTDRNLYLAEVLFPYDWESGVYSLDGASDIAEPALSYVPAWIHNSRVYQNMAEFPTANPLSAPAMGDSLDRGYNIVVHVGHGNKDILRASGGSYMGMSDVSALTNGQDRASFLWMLNCTTAAIDYDCIAERFMNNPDGGSAGLFGPTRYAFPATSRSYYWDWLDLLYNHATTKAGPLCSGAKALHASYEESGADNTDRWTQLATVLLGDPELTLWTGRPSTMTAGHPSSVQVGDTGITVTVTDPSPVDSAFVCIEKAGDVYARGTTNASGQVTLSFIPDTTGTLTVTVTAPGYIPYESTVSVQAASGAHVYLESTDLDDDVAGASDGNGNGLFESGETVELDVTAMNSGTASAGQVTATLSSSDGYIIVEDGTEFLGSINAGYSSFADAAFRFSSTIDAPNEHDVVFTIEFSEGARALWSEEFQVRVYRPDLCQLYVDLDDSAGNGNGIPETGETVDVSIEILNDGNGDAGSVVGSLRYPSGAVTVTDSTDSWGDVTAGAAASGAGGFTFTVASSIADHFRLALTDDEGRSWSSYIDFLKPSGPDTVYGNVKGTTIDLSWDVVPDSDLLGYDIYRAEDMGGPYVVANDAVIEGTAYFSDAGLDENSLYHYYVVAVDSSGNRSDNSLLLSISTNPPSLIGWPLDTQAGMYASAGCADVDGDGGLEIVIPSDHIYVWHADGTEVLDGDGDPRTGGIFETDGVGGYRASAAIGEVDGDPGMEIVAPAWANVGSDIDPAYEVYVWNGENGSVLPGWPVTTKKFCWSSPALADLDHDGRSEILLPCADGKLYCWRYNGSEYIDGDDDPLTLGVFANLGGSWVYGSPAIADLDGDRELEIIQASTSDSVYAWHSDGSRVAGWPFWVESNSYMSPSVGDIDNDGYLEVVVSSNADKVWALERDATVMPGWPRTIQFSEDFSPSPVFADLTGDGYLEIVLGGRNGSLTVKDYLGNDLPGWPVAMGGNSLSSPAVADIDGDPEFEIVAGCKDGKLYCFDVDGSILPGWPIQTASDITSSPLVCDIDEDGDIEVIIGGMDTRVYVWDCAGDFADGDGVAWGCFLHDEWRTQHYEFVVPTGVDEDGSEWASFAGVELHQNSPNPFNPVTTIAFVVPAADADGDGSPVSLVVYDVAGRAVRTLIDATLTGGRYGAVWDGKDESGRDVSSGVYFYRIDAGEASDSKKMVLLK
ncbi:MAG: C25 family cysteine peptidase [Candidatus Eisenbacteria bacterium]